MLHDISCASGINRIQGVMYDRGEALDLSARSSGNIHTSNAGFLGPNFAYLDEFTAMPVPQAGNI